MARAKVVATYKPNETELFQVTVTASTSYPDALAEARSTAVRAVSEMLTDALEQYGVRKKA